MSGPILPVICGFDIADYAFARIFHESLGLRSLVISDIRRGPINDSRILDVRMVPLGTLADEHLFIDCLRRVAAEYPDRRLILCVNTDEGVEFASRHRAELGPQWFLPYADPEVVERANSKNTMAEIFASAGLAVPRRAIIDLSAPDTWTSALEDMPFPVVAKPEDGATLNFYRKQGLRKAIPIENLDQALVTFEAWREHGVAIRLIVQELIPGDDTTQWVVNGYVDQDGHVTAAGSGRVLLGLHQPDVIGNAAMILVQRNDVLVAAAQKAVQAAGLRGFFSLDVKVDPRTQTPYWLDLNPRIGRGHYYMKIGGIDLARAVVADMDGTAVPYQSIQREGVYTVVPMLLANHHYLRDPNLLAQVRRLRRNGDATNPLAYNADENPKRLLYRLLNGVNQLRFMHTYYPRPTDSGF
jgi:D-aspartate ligase